MLRLRTKVTVVADGLAAQLVGQLGHGADLAAAGAEQRDDLVVADLLAGGDAVEHLGDRPPWAEDGRRDQRGRVDVGARVPLRRAAPDEHDLGAVADVADLADRRCGNTAPGSSRAEALGVGAVDDGEAQALVEPGRGVAAVTYG